MWTFTKAILSVWACVFVLGASALAIWAAYNLITGQQ